MLSYLFSDLFWKHKKTCLPALYPDIQTFSTHFAYSHFGPPPTCPSFSTFLLHSFTRGSSKSGRHHWCFPKLLPLIQLSVPVCPLIFPTPLTVHVISACLGMWTSSDQFSTGIQSWLALAEGNWFLIPLRLISMWCRTHTRMHTHCRIQPGCFCNISLVQRGNNTSFLTCSSPLSLPTLLTHPPHQLLSPTRSLSSLISWLHGNICFIAYSTSFSFSHFSRLSRVSKSIRLCPGSLMYDVHACNTHKHTHIHTQTFTYTIDGNLACVITVTLSCLGVLSHLALVFAASFTPSHTHSPFPPNPILLLHPHSRRHPLSLYTHAGGEQRRSKRDDNPA